MRLYDYPASGNCLKVRILLAHLGVSCERVEIDIFGGDTLTAEYAAKSPRRQTPLLEVDGTFLPESAAILWYLADGTAYLPRTAFGRASVIRWLLFEQERVGQIAARRFRVAAGICAAADESAVRLRELGRQALDALEAHLASRRFLVDDRYSIADIANYAYVHVAPEADLDLAEYPNVRRWVARVENQPGFVNDLAPLPADARVGLGLSIYG